MKIVKKYDLCIIGGMGHVGLPLGLAFARKGQKVMLYDTFQERIDKIARGKMPFIETGGEEILKKVLRKTLFFSSDKNVIRESRFVIIIIGTPADRYLNPEFSKFKRLFDEVIDFIDNGQHIILRSTVYPGTTNKIRDYLRRKGKRPRISFCPERISQGHAIEEILELPQIIGGCGETANREAKGLFGLLVDELIVLEPKEAELAKLFANAWRYLEFAIANQFYKIATDENIDFYKIYDALTRKYPRAAGYKKAGFAAGPCLFKDTAYLLAYTGNSFFLGSSAMLINEGLPNFISHRLNIKYGLSGKTVGILGMTFKADNDDKRDSLAFKLRKILETEAAKVLCSDVYLREEGFVDPAKLIRDSDIVVVGCPHSAYKKVKIPKGKILVDVWNFFGKGSLF